ncbi:transcriptional regulator, TetR family [Bacillus sp. JCM 19047]|nr:transcriptional regulator, TetR family [Bacillus sp. JCM 19047]
MSKKREQLLAQSERLFDQHGFHAVGLKQVIKEAEISLMTMYNHFESKEALILEILKKKRSEIFTKAKPVY